MSIFSPQDEQYVREWSVGKTAIDKPTGFGENLASSFSEYENNDANGALRESMRQAYNDRISKVRDMTGLDLKNPYGPESQAFHQSVVEDVNPDELSGYDKFIWNANRLTSHPIDTLMSMFDSSAGGGNEYQRIQSHEEEISRARSMLPPDARGLIPTREDIQKSVQDKAKEIEAKNADIARRATGGGIVGQMLGSAGASTLQPEVLATLPLGAPARVGLLARVLIDAGIGAGSQALMEPGIQLQRKQLGLESGLDQAAGDIASAGFGAGLFSLGTAAIGQILKGGARAFEKKFGRPPMPEEQAAIDLAQQATSSEAATPYKEKTAAAAAVYQKNEAAAAAAALEGRHPIPAEMAPADGLTSRELTQGLNLQILRNADLDKIGVDADLMQFKTGGDQFGVTERLQGVKEWNPERAGMTLVYEYADGRQIIADGHQRLGLAKRLAAEGQDIEMPAYILREADGITPEQARARAAFKNIAEGTGSAADAAKVLRDLGVTAADLNLPPKSALVRDAEGLQNLNDDVFGMVINQVIEERYGAVIGRMVREPALQTDIAKLLARLKPANTLEAEQIVDQARRAGVVHGKQTSLFGEEDIAESLYLERARVLDRSLKMLRRNSATYRTLLEQEGEITGAGNVLDQATNAQRLQQQGAAENYLRALANRKGVISDALTEAARAAKDAGNYQAPARAFLEALDRGIKDGTISRDAGRADGYSSEFAAPAIPDEATPTPTEIIPDEDTLSMFDSPTDQPAKKAVDNLETQIRVDTQASIDGIMTPKISEPIHLQMLDPVGAAETVRDFKMSSPARTLEDFYSTAGKHQEDFARLGKTLGRRKGVEFVNPGLKSLEGAREKMIRKAYPDTRDMTDIIRSGFTVETPAQAAGLVDAIAKKYPVIDEGWKIVSAGYFDRKLLVKFPDGSIGEVQFWHPKMLKVKESKGHAIYEKMRKLDASDPKYAELVAQQETLYRDALASMPEDWRALVETSWPGNGGAEGNSLLKTEAGTSTPESNTSSSLAGTQASEPGGANQAVTPSTMAGRPSQSMSLGNDVPPYRTVTGESFRAMLNDAGGYMDKVSTEIANQVQSALSRGDVVVRYSEGKPIRIVNVERGMLQDASGQRWGNLNIATEKGSANRIEFHSLPSEVGADGLQQTLIPGVAPVSDLERMRLEAGRAMRGGNAPMDIGLFGDAAKQLDMMDFAKGKNSFADMLVPVGEAIDQDGKRVSKTQTVREILDDIEADQDFLDQLAACDRSAA